MKVTPQSLLCCSHQETYAHSSVLCKSHEYSTALHDRPFKINAEISCSTSSPFKCQLSSDWLLLTNRRFDPQSVKKTNVATLKTPSGVQLASFKPQCWRFGYCHHNYKGTNSTNGFKQPTSVILFCGSEAEHTPLRGTT